MLNFCRPYSTVKNAKIPPPPIPGKLPTIRNAVARNAPGAVLYCNHQPNLVDQMNCKNFNTTKLFNKNAKNFQPVVDWSTVIT